MPGAYRTSSVAVDTNYTMHAGHYLRGLDKEQQRLSLDECKSYCDAKDWCDGFSHQRNGTSRCWFKQNVKPKHLRSSSPRYRIEDSNMFNYYEKN